MARPLPSTQINVARATSHAQQAAWTLALSAALGCAGVLATAQTAPQAPPALVADLADFVEMPRTPGGDGRSTAARVNVLIEEPGSGRLFVAEHAGPLSIVDKTSRKAVTYINFNGLPDAPGLFAKFAPTGGFVSGLMGFAFDPDYRRNGMFYTIHLEDPALTVDGKPRAGVLPGLDASRFVPTKPISMPANGQPLTREAVLSEWTDSNIKNATFEGTAREVMRVQLLNAIHPTSDLTFNPTAARGSADWRVLYVSTGDGGTGEASDVRRLNPQRLDHFSGTIIRIVPDLREHASTSLVSENGQYRIPNDNPFVSTPGARKEIFAHGMRNPHRLAWDVGAGPAAQPTLLAFVIGSNMGSPVRYETINVVRRGANYGYPLREGPEFKPESPIFGPRSADNTLPLRISDTVVLEQRVPMQDSALAYKTGVEGLAIANGFVYRGKRWPQLQGAVVFGDITSGRLFYARMADLIAATDGNPTTLAPYTEITTTLSSLAEERVRANPNPVPVFGRRGGPGAAGAAGPAAPGTTPAPGAAPTPAPGPPATAPTPAPAPPPATAPTTPPTPATAPAPPAGSPAGRAGGPGAGPGGAAMAPRPLRVELRIATDEAGEIYILTKSDGFIRRVTSIR